MKKLFRFLTGELNGFYINNLAYCINNTVDSMTETLQYFQSMVYKGELTVSGTELPIRESDLLGIAKTAGIFMPTVKADSTDGSLRFSNSRIVDKVKYSERGLFDREVTKWRYFRTNQNTYSTDITALATRELQASFVPEGQPVLGYIAEGISAMDDDGFLKPECLLAVPPVGQAYYPFYGEKFLHLSEVFLKVQELGYEEFLVLVEAIQRVRYNGVTIKDFLSITTLLLGDYIRDIEFETRWENTLVRYRINVDSELLAKIRRFFAWEYVVRTQFKRFILEQGAI